MLSVSSHTLLLVTTIVGLFGLFTIYYIYSNTLCDNDRIKRFNETKQFSINQKQELNAINTNLSFTHAFIASISIIVLSEIGDKTFFIAAILAMRHSRLIVYIGAISALGSMTILSGLLGNILTQFIPRNYTYYLSTILLAYFGIKMLIDGYYMSFDEGTKEYKEVEHEIEIAEVKENQLCQRLSNKRIFDNISIRIRSYVSPIFMQAFIMTYLAEWGDRSQITTMVLATSKHFLGVIMGGIIGHSLCSSLAVIAGRFLAQRISPKTVTFIGGMLLLNFAISTFFIRSNE